MAHWKGLLISEPSYCNLRYFIQVHVFSISTSSFNLNCEKKEYVKLFSLEKID